MSEYYENSAKLRAIKLVKILIDHPNEYTRNQLADMFNVHPDTIKTDFRYIRAAGFALKHSDYPDYVWEIETKRGFDKRGEANHDSLRDTTRKILDMESISVWGIFQAIGENPRKWYNAKRGKSSIPHHINIKIIHEIMELSELDAYSKSNVLSFLKDDRIVLKRAICPPITNNQYDNIIKLLSKNISLTDYYLSLLREAIINFQRSLPKNITLTKLS